MKTIGTILALLVTLILTCFLCSQISDTVIYDPAAVQPGITLQSEPIPAATLEERAAFWLSVWNGLIVVTALLSAGFLVWGAVMLLGPLADGLDKLVGVLDRFRKVIFDSQMDAIQVKKSDRMSDLDVEIAGARFEHDRQKALIALDRIQDVTDIEVVERAHRLKMLQEQGRLSLRAKREAMKSEVIQ